MELYLNRHILVSIKVSFDVVRRLHFPINEYSFVFLELGYQKLDPATAFIPVSRTQSMRCRYTQRKCE